MPEIPAGECGNRVIDEGEDCDTFSPNDDSLCRSPGSVDECHLDCSRLGNGTRRPCPPDWGCTLDDICRPVTGKFEQRVDAALGNGGQLMSADFDGDGRDDVVSLEPVDTLGRTRLRFHYFDDTVGLEQSVGFPKLVFPPVIADLSRDARSDVVFSDGRIGLLIGQGRSWVPETFGSYRLPNSQVRMIAPYDRLIMGANALVALTTLAGQAQGFYIPNATNVLQLIGELPGPLDALAGDPATGNVLESASSPCSEAALALRGAVQFHLVDFCTRNAQGEVHFRTQVDMLAIELSPPAPIDSPPQLVDMNRDGHLDVLVGANGRPYVAYGDGVRLAAATPFYLELANPSETSTDVAMPLAAGDFTSDGWVDFVFADHLLVSSPAPSGPLPNYLVHRPNVGRTWTEAIIADLNHNGKLDVIAASRDRPNIDFFNGTGNEHPTAFNLATGGPAHELAIGDFDGDLVADLAFVETSASQQRPDSVMIAFGNLAGSPAAPAAVARINGMEQLSVYREGQLGSLMVASKEREGQFSTGVLTLLEGSGDRSLIAPYSLTLFAADGNLRQSSALSLAAGAFTAPGKRDVLAVASPDLLEKTWEFWLLPELYSKSSVPVLLKPSEEINEHLLPARSSSLPGDYSVHVNLTSTSADLDGDGRDEAVFGMPTDSGGCGLVFTDLQGSDSIALQTLMIPDPCERPQLAAADVDADGALDIALLTGMPGSSDGKLLLFWNDGRGAFALSRFQRVSDAADSPTQFTVLPATSERAFSFAYVTDSAARIVTASATPREFQAAETLAPLERGTGIVAADLNGDGALDLALTDSGSLGVLQAKLLAP